MVFGELGKMCVVGGVLWVLRLLILRSFLVVFRCWMIFYWIFFLVRWLCCWGCLVLGKLCCCVLLLGWSIKLVGIFVFMVLMWVVCMYVIVKLVLCFSIMCCFVIWWCLIILFLVWWCCCVVSVWMWWWLKWKW